MNHNLIKQENSNIGKNYIEQEFNREKYLELINYEPNMSVKEIFGKQ